MRARYIPTAEIDEKIKRAYSRQRSGDRNALRAVRGDIGWSKSAVVRRGAELCVTRAKERPWCAAEEDILERFGYLTAAGVQRKLMRAGFQRSRAAVQLKTTRLRIKRNLDGYSACALAMAFGVDAHKVCTWIRRGLLQAERRHTAYSTQRDTWWIPISSVRRFILRAPEEIDLSRVEKFWFLDIVTGGKICR
ncbi:MAG: hypothetical protein JO319_19185 [Acidobacteriaceae bacterium]|nr:hypothetical protein [Acidobacteriaceae bacterium]